MEGVLSLLWGLTGASSSALGAFLAGLWAGHKEAPEVRCVCAHSPDDKLLGILQGQLERCGPAPGRRRSLARRC